MTDRELFAQAAAALKVSAWDHIHAVGKQALIDAIIDRLAQPDAEPVAHLWKFASGELVVWGGDPKDGGSRVFPVYAAPPAAPAPAVPDDAAMTLLKELRHALEPISAYGRVGTRDVEQAKLQHLVAMIDRVLSAAPAVPLTDTRKLCTCDGAGRGPGRACVVQAGGRLGELWKCAKSAAPAVPPFNPQAECSPTLTQCPRCNNPHHACDRGAAPAVREPQFGNKRAIFQAGRDSYKTACQPMNTDDEAWNDYLRGIGGGGNG